MLRNSFLKYLIVTVLFLVGLNLYISFSLSSQIEEQFKAVSGESGNELILKLGDVSNSPFRGNITLHNLIYEGDDSVIRSSLKQLTLDLTYLDFLRLYFWGVGRGLNYVDKAHLNLKELELAHSYWFSDLSLSRIALTYEGNMTELIRLIVYGVFPSSPLSVGLESREITVTTSLPAFPGTPISISDATLRSSYNPETNTLEITAFSLEGPAVKSEINGTISFDAFRRYVTIPSGMDLHTTFFYQAEEDAPVIWKTRKGTLQFSSISWKHHILSKKTGYSGINWFNLTGNYHLVLENTKFEPPASFTEKYGFVMNALAGSEKYIPLHKITVSGNSAQEMINVDSLLLDHEHFDVLAKGAIVKNNRDLLRSAFKTFEITLKELSGEQQKMVANLASLIGLRMNPDSTSVTVGITGTLRNPRPTL